MNYPLISEYIESIKSAEDNFEELSYLKPVLGDDGLPVMTSGNFAVVFKMKDERDGKFYAVKCFTKEQDGREEAYREIAKELKDVSSPYLVSIRYLEKELFVDTEQTAETEFPVLMMDWVEGKTLDIYLRENLDDKYALEMLAYRFSQLAQWLIPQPFAHGDLKPDNILVREDGTLVLVDYDGMYVPAMKGQKARELGSPDFRHPLRTENDFDEHIDDFSLVSILISLRAIAFNPHWLAESRINERLLFSGRDYACIDTNRIIQNLFLVQDSTLHNLLCIFSSLCKRCFTFTLPCLEKPYITRKVNSHYIWAIKLLSPPLKIKCNSISIEDVIKALLDLDDLMNANGIDYILTGSLALLIHGLVPKSYIPHDIDIIIGDNSNKHPYLTNQMIIDLFVQYSGGARPEYSNYSASDMFLFYIGNQRIEVNAFIDRKNVFSSSDYCIMNIIKHDIKVNNVLSILKEKYKLHRLKDFEFNNKITTTLNSFFEPEQTKDFEEIYNEMILTDKIRDFFNGIKWVLNQTEIKIFEILFNKNVAKIWLPQSVWEKCIIKATSWDNDRIKNSIIFGKEGEFTNIIKIDKWRVFQGCLKHDMSYMVDFLYHILSTMKIVDYFVEHVSELICAINEHEKPLDDPNDLSF